MSLIGIMRVTSPHGYNISQGATSFIDIVLIPKPGVGLLF